MHSRRLDVDDPGFRLDLKGLKQNLARSPEAEATSLLGADTREVVSMAPNAIEWAVGREWCNAPETYDFQRSYQLIRDFFQLRCPVCNHGRDPDLWKKPRTYLESEVLLRWRWDDLDYVCPKCATTQADFIDQGKLTFLNQLHAICGQRSGKTITGALIATYVEHVLLSIGHLYPGGLHGYLDRMSPAVKFEMTFVASNQVQTDDTIWALYTGFRKRSPWFQRYAEWIKLQEKYQAVRPGMKRWRYIEHEKAIVNEHPNLRLKINALNSNSNGQAGRTRLAVFIDEMARMKKTASAFGADEIYATLEASLQTTRSRRLLAGGLPWLGAIVSVTSPISRTDRAWTLWKQASVGEIPGMHTVRYATWDFNPKEPRANFATLMKKDPVLTMRNFGAMPPGAEFPYLHDESLFAQLAIDAKATPSAIFAYVQHTGPLGHKYLGVKLKTARRAFNAKEPRYIVFDAGLNFDAFTGVCAHAETILDAAGETHSVTRYDWAFRIVVQPGMEAWFRSALEVVRDYKKYAHIARVEFDRWNSAQLIQDIRDLGISADPGTVRKDDFNAWRLAAYSGQLRMLPPREGEVVLESDGSWRLPFEWKVRQALLSAEGAALAEAFELQQDPDSFDVYNPQKGEVRGEHSDDMVRVCVHAHKLVQSANTTLKQHDQSREARRKRVERGAARLTGQVIHTPRGVRRR